MIDATHKKTYTSPYDCSHQVIAMSRITEDYEAIAALYLPSSSVQTQAGLFFFLCHPRGNTKIITVIDLSDACSYERDEWRCVTPHNYTDLQEAIADAQQLAAEFSWQYQLFSSRYNESLNEHLMSGEPLPRNDRTTMEGVFYFLIHPSGDVAAIAVTDLSHASSYERDEWRCVSPHNYTDLQEAISDAKRLAERLALRYVPFSSRYNETLNEISPSE